ncbi:WG repeat-containing protein [Streptomyces sp. NPDC047014]|uniref:WG repeat-containing protein n=1 Tax=Streptomyces sp. NPDC047014 TaxID=3155736 RepID=UPI0033C08731
MSRSTPPVPRAVPVEGGAPFGRRFALVDPAAGLVRPPDLSAVGRFRADGRGGLVAPAADLSGRWGYLDGRGHWLAEPALEHATDFDGAGLSRFLADGAWGYADTAGTPVGPARFTEAGPFSYGLAAVRTPEGVGYADPTGAVVIGGTYRQAGRFGPNGLGGVMLPDGRCGYVGREGRTVIAPRFEGARPFTATGTAPVCLGGLWGLIDTEGEWILPPSFTLCNAFDENGLAYVIGGGPGDSFAGFVDTRGTLVLRRDGEMDDALSCGLLKVGNEFTRGYLDATGAPAIEPVYAWTDRFDRGGAAVALPAGQTAWGVLRTDGSFTPTPHAEPLTDTDSWITGFDGGHGLAPFLTTEGDIVHVDREGRDLCRIRTASADGSTVALLDAAGRTLWEDSTAPGTFERNPLFLSADARTHIDHPETAEGDIGAAVRALLDLPARTFRPTSLICDRDEDPYDLSALDDYDLERTHEGAILTIASTWLAAEWLTEYPFLQERTQQCFAEILDTCVDRLSSHLGRPPLADSATLLRGGDGEWSADWEVDGRRLVLQLFELVGDGDHEIQIWLAVTTGTVTQGVTTP